MRGFLFRLCETLGIKPIAFTASQIEIILITAQTVNAFEQMKFFSRAVEHLRDKTQIDDALVRRACDQARQEFRQPE